MICVTGMHRSGTSMLCQLIEQLGVSFGDSGRFYATDRWNEAGYYEDRYVMDVNSRLITGFARNEGKIACELSKLRYLTMPGHVTIRRRFPALKSRIEQLIAELGDIAVKDPRFCVTLGCWEEVQPMSRVVVSYRHPMEVATSLHRRQRIPLRLGYRFWNYHARQLVEEASPDRSVFVDFNQLGTEDHLSQVRPLVRALGLEHSNDSCTQAVESVFKSKLVHCKSHDESRMPVATQQIWSRLADLADRCRDRWASTPPTPAGFTA